MATTFKSYSEKSKAARALVQVHKLDKQVTGLYLSQDSDGRWGFTLGDDGAPVSVGLHHATDSPKFGEERTVDADALPTEADVQALAPQADEGAALAALVVEQDLAQNPDAPEHQADAPDDEQPVTPSAFGAFAMSQLTAPSNTAPVEPQRTSTSQRVAGLKIEKNREERNGVKMPSVGGMCRAVWDALNSMMQHDEASGTATVPTVADIKKLAEEKGWNVNNASIEYYQWRKWHGITGRGKKTI
jgi:hypothetical protein